MHTLSAEELFGNDRELGPWAQYEFVQWLVNEPQKALSHLIWAYLKEEALHNLFHDEPQLNLLVHLSNTSPEAHAFIDEALNQWIRTNWEDPNFGLGALRISCSPIGRLRAKERVLHLVRRDRNGEKLFPLAYAASVEVFEAVLFSPDEQKALKRVINYLNSDFVIDLTGRMFGCCYDFEGIVNFFNKLAETFAGFEGYRGNRYAANLVKGPTFQEALVKIVRAAEIENIPFTMPDWSVLDE